MIRSHQVARVAFDCVTRRVTDTSTQKKYGALAHKLPGMILQNGLAQATGFLLAKGSSAPEHLLLLDDLKDVLRAGGTLIVDDRVALHQAILDANLLETVQYTRAALEASAWLKRYVQGLLKVSATGDNQLGD
jgi:CRISPR-associated protein Cmr5